MEGTWILTSDFPPPVGVEVRATNFWDYETLGPEGDRGFFNYRMTRQESGTYTSNFLLPRVDTFPFKYWHSTEFLF
jgi:hypothetical protein